MKEPKVAIVHDWLIGGGAELVVEQLHQLYPNAPIYTSCATEEWQKRLHGKVVTSYMQNWPFKHLRKFLPVLRAIWFSRLKLNDYDLVISSSGAEAKGVKTSPNTLHVNYCHAPTHYYWSRYEEYMQQPGFGAFDPLAKLGLKLLLSPMRHWDLKAAKRPDVMLANSTHIQKEIKKYYGRDSIVVHPPVDVGYFKPEGKPTRKGFVITGRHTAYKRFDLAVEACTNLGLPLKVLGNGPVNKKLRAIAGPSVTFYGHAPREKVREYVQGSVGFIFPGLDDFGISAVEALAAGTPVIAYKAAGALDYIKDRQNGIFFEKQTTESLGKALQEFQTLQLSQSFITKSVERFSENAFRKNMETVISKSLNERKQS